MFPIKLLLFAFLIFPVNKGDASDCITEAAQCFDLNLVLIKVIIWQESQEVQERKNENSNKRMM